MSAILGDLLMDYNRHFRVENMVYSIDYFQVDFGLGGIYDDVVEMLRASFNLQSCKMFGKLDCDSGIKHLSRYDLYWWQYGGLHVELWPKSVYQKCGSFREDDEGEQIQNDVTLKGISWFLRFKFNPNKNKDNPVLKTVLSFLLDNGWVCGWSFSRVDYALDVEGPIKDFYVFSRKRETNYGSTRYYGVRGSSGYLRVYDKRREQREVFKEDIGYELTRFEWEQRGNRDLDFTFDQFSHMDVSGLDGSARCLQYVAPENINAALLEFAPNTRTKIKKKLFSPVTVKKEFFQKLLDEYVKEYGLSGIRVFTDSQSFDLCDHPD